MKKTGLLLTLILGLGIFLRVFKLTTLPPSLFADEVDAGYQAAYFLQNQSDYFGNKYPVHFRSFSDYRTSLYIYSIAFFQKLTGNWELSVRLPSVFFSVLSILLLYYLTKSLSAAFLLAVSPWSIHYGRTGFEVSGMLFVLLSGTFFFFRYLKNFRLIHLLFSVFFFCLSPYFYSTAKLFLPLMGIILIFINYQQIKTLPARHIFLSLLVGFILFIPLLKDTFTGKSGFRFSYISIFTEPHREQLTDSFRYQDVFSDNIGIIGLSTPPLSYLFHNKYQLVWDKFVTNYFSSFSTDFLFLRGDANPRHGFGAFGLLYFIDFFMILFGVFLSLKNPSSLSKFFLLLLVFAPVPFALTRDSVSPHSTRLILMLPSLVYFSSLVLRRLPFLLPLYLVFTFTFYHYYQFHYPQTSARSWHTGLKEAVLLTSTNNSSSVYFSDTSEPFLPFFVFYNHFLPADALTNHLADINTSSFSGKSLNDRYFFGHFNFDNLTQIPSGSIIVLPKSEFDNHQNNVLLIDSVQKHYLNQEEFFILKKI